MRCSSRLCLSILVGLASGACRSEPAPDSGTSSEIEEIPVDPDVETYYPEDRLVSDPVRIVFFGDSITRGYGIEREDNKYTALLRQNNDGRWPSFAADDLRARFPALEEVVDASRDGSTTDTVLQLQLSQIADALGPVVEGETIVAGTIGGNDLLDVLLSGDVPAGVDALMDNLKEIADFFTDPVRFPDGVYLAIGNVYDPTDGTGQADECFFGFDLSAVIPEFDRLAEESRAMAERDGWAWVDMRGHFRGHGFRYDEEGDWADPEDPTLWFQDDCIHPNTRGHHEIRRLFLAAIDGVPLPLVEPAE